MSCGHCVTSVTEEVERVSGVQAVDVDLDTKLVRVAGTGLDPDAEHTKRMHLIVVRRDLTRFQHLHPTQSGDGTWSTPLTLAESEQHAGQEGDLRFRVSRDGRHVTPQPYLGARGRLRRFKALPREGVAEDTSIIGA